MIRLIKISAFAQYGIGDYERLMSQIPLFPMRGSALAEYIKKMIQNGVVYALDDESVLEGLIGFYANDKMSHAAYLSAFVVDESLRGKGFGKILFGRMLEICEASGMVSIAANVLCSNERAVQFYRRQGFAIVGKGQDDNHILIRKDGVRIV